MVTQPGDLTANAMAIAVVISLSWNQHVGPYRGVWYVRR